MKLRKVMALTLAGAMAATSLTACSSNSAGTAATTAAAGTEAAAGTTAAAGNAGSADAEITLQVAFENSISEPVGQGWVKAQEIIREKSGGTMAIEVYPDSQLGDKSSLIDSMLLGENVCTLADGAFYADYGVPDFGIVFGPFLFDSWDQCWTLIESDWYKEQCAKLEEKGLKLIASNWIYGERHTLTNVPVNTVDDLKGLKIRIPGSRIYMTFWEAVGASPTAMSWSEVFTAIQQGTIDGQENGAPITQSAKMDEVQDYMTIWNYAYDSDLIICNTTVWESLDENTQALLQECITDACEWGRDKIEKEEEEIIEEFIAGGMQVDRLTEEQLAPFQEMIKESMKEIKADYGKTACDAFNIDTEGVSFTEEQGEQDR